MSMDIISVLFFLSVFIVSFFVGALVSAGIMTALERIRAHRALQPMLGVVTPREEDHA